MSWIDTERYRLTRLRATLEAKSPLKWSSYLQHQLSLVHATTIGRWALRILWMLMAQ